MSFNRYAFALVNAEAKAKGHLLSHTTWPLSLASLRAF